MRFNVGDVLRNIKDNPDIRIVVVAEILNLGYAIRVVSSVGSMYYTGKGLFRYFAELESNYKRLSNRNNYIAYNYKNLRVKP